MDELQLSPFTARTHKISTNSVRFPWFVYEIPFHPTYVKSIGGQGRTQFVIDEKKTTQSPENLAVISKLK